MRLRTRDGTVVHLAYCSNVHAAEELEGVVAQLARYAEPVRHALDADRLGVGLWLADDVARELDAAPAAVAQLARELDGRSLEVVSLNGFPYRGFHDPVVKRAVYLPDWTDAARAEHTVRLARILSALLPDDVERGSVSTVPLAWRAPWTAEQDADAAAAVRRVGEELAALHDSTGRRIDLAIEPEPGCVLERIDDTAAWLARHGLTRLDGHVGVCLDACHLAVQFEEPDAALAACADVGATVAKAQVSAGLRVRRPADDLERAALTAFEDPRFLHQTREQAAPRPLGVDDLDEALGGGLPGRGEWRVHFHAPLHADDEGPVGTTRAELEATLAALVGGDAPRTTHLEVETYTWTVLPASLRPRDDAGLVEGIARELAWTRDRLLDLGLVEVPA